jgi:PKD repeat protein
VVAVVAAAALWVAAPTATSGASVGEGVVVEPADGPNAEYVDVRGGEVALDLTDVAGGAGVNPRATTFVDDVFVVRNDGDRVAYVHVSDNTSRLGFYRSTPSRPSIEDRANETRLAPGDAVVVGLSVAASAPGSLDPGEFSVDARVREALRAVVGPGERVPAGDERRFDATGSRGDGLSYEWRFGDGTTATGATPSHTYAEPGVYTVELTVRDDRGETATTSREVVALVDRAVNETPATSDERVRVDSRATPLREVRVEPDSGGLDRLRVDVHPGPGPAVAVGQAPPTETTVAAANVVPDRTDVAADVSVTVDADAVPSDVSASALALYRYDDADGRWERLETTVDASDGTVTATARTPGFSVFVVGVPAEADTTPTPTATPTGQTGGGGGGGGGVGGPSCQLRERVRPAQDDVAGSYSTLESSTTDRVAFEFAGDASGVLRVTCRNGGSSYATPSAPGAVVDHYRLAVPNGSAGVPATAEFAVRPSRLEAVGASPERLAVFVWDGSWRRVETEVRRGDEAVVVTARLDALPELLAVAAPPAGTDAPERTGPGATPTPTREPTTEPAGEGVVTRSPTATDATTTPPPTDGRAPGLGVATALAALTAAAVLWVRRRGR